MAALRRSYVLGFLLPGLAVLYVVQCASATEYRVGGSAGWAPGTDFQHWASQYTFESGDDLFFPYHFGNDSVLLVTEDDYNSCNITKPIASDDGQGNMVTILKKADTYYFICGDEGHCLQGQRLTIQVVAPATSIGPTSSFLTPSNSPIPYTPPPYKAPYSTFHHYSHASITFKNAIMVSLLSIAIALAFT